MTAVPPRPAAGDLQYPLGRHCCGAPNPSICHQRGVCWMAGVHPDSPGYRPAAPDATAGDGLRSAELVARLAEAIQDHRDAATGPTTPEQDYRPGAPCMGCGEYPGPLHERSDCPRAVARALLPALRDVLAAAARDAELREAVTSLAVRFHTLGEVLHSVPAADAYDDAAESLRDALDPS